MSIAGTTQAAIDNYRRTTDPLGIWLDEHTETADGWISRKVLRDAYSESCQLYDRIPMTEESFGKAFKRLRREVRPVQRTGDAGKEWGYAGMQFKADRPPI